MSIFDKWDSSTDIRGLEKDVEESRKNGLGSRKEVPVGTYEVKVQSMEIKECKSEKNKGAPMVTITFKVLAGEHKGECIFYNQLIMGGWQIGLVNEFLESFYVEGFEEIKFKGYSRYNDLILDMMEKIDGNYEYLLDYGQSKKGFATFKIKEVYDVE